MTKSTGVGRGGKREGAGGRTADLVSGVASITLTMDEDTERVAYELGNGNYGVGVRRAIQELLILRRLLSNQAPALSPILQSTAKHRTQPRGSSAKHAIDKRANIMAGAQKRSEIAQAKKRGGQVGMDTPIPPTLREVSEKRPESEGGGTYNITALRRLREEAKAEYDREMLEYKKACSTS